jgi:DNA polymerase III alpha subunit (gram-positive type)
MNTEIVILDLETSGVEVNGNGIIEFRAITADAKSGEVISQFSLLTKPESPEKLPKLVEEITGISNDFINSAVNNQLALSQFEEYAGSNPIWVYNHAFTNKFLKKISHKDYELGDILAAARKMNLSQSGSRIESVAEAVGVPINNDLGRMRDCFIAKDILIKALEN